MKALVCWRSLALAAAMCLALSQAAQATYTVSIQQVGANVVVTGGGSIDTSVLTSTGGTLSASASSAGIEPSDGFVFFDPTGAVLNDFAGLVGPLFGIGGFEFASTTSGAPFGFVGVGGPGGVFLPMNYVSGSQVGAVTATFLASTLSSLGLTQGEFVYTAGNVTEVILDIGPVRSAVPEPATISLLGLGASVALLRRKRLVS